METKKLFSGAYEVTSEGEVFSRKRGGCRLLKGAVFRSGHGSTKYRTVLLTVNGKQKNYYVHRLVAEAFVPNPMHFPCVRHKDGDFFNNRADNLEWCTRSMAIQSAVDDGRINVWKNAAPCARCGKPMISKKSDLCGECQALFKKEQKKDQRAQRIAQSLQGVSCEMLSPLQRQAVELRKQGKTYQAIAQNMGISCQYAHQLIKLAMARAGCFSSRTGREPQYIAQYQAAQARKRERKQVRLEKMLEEADKLSRELRTQYAAIPS